MSLRPDSLAFADAPIQLAQKAYEPARLAQTLMALAALGRNQAVVEVAGLVKVALEVRGGIRFIRLPSIDIDQRDRVISNHSIQVQTIHRTCRIGI